MGAAAEGEATISRAGAAAAAKGEATISKKEITVNATLFASLRRRRPDIPDGPQRVALPAGATLADLLAALGLARDLDVAAAVNGDLAAPDTVLPDNAEVILMTPMEGGAATAGGAAIAGGAAAEGEATISTEGGTTR